MILCIWESMSLYESSPLRRIVLINIKMFQILRIFFFIKKSSKDMIFVSRFKENSILKLNSIYCSIRTVFFLALKKMPWFVNQNYLSTMFNFVLRAMKQNKKKLPEFKRI